MLINCICRFFLSSRNEFICICITFVWFIFLDGGSFAHETYVRAFVFWSSVQAMELWSCGFLLSGLLCKHKCRRWPIEYAAAVVVVVIENMQARAFFTNCLLFFFSALVNLNFGSGGKKKKIFSNSIFEWPTGERGLNMPIVANTT